MRRNTVLATLALTGVTLTGVATAPAQAAPRPATATQAAVQADAKTVQPAQVGVAATKVKVTIAMDQLGKSKAITDALNSIKTDNRGTFVRDAMNKAFVAAGSRHNVMVFNLSQGYKERLTNKRVYANVQWGNIYYGLWIFESGEFTNTGDGGWINWGFRGWFDRNDKHVKFKRSW
ncbi:stress protein [Streptomyces sp. NPDC093109]|uniref:stress protein n=1 Tax=Streptomyces sp. NPDC093109 TaxID=3154977 RepID=UPI003450C6BA